MTKSPGKHKNPVPAQRVPDARLHMLTSEGPPSLKIMLVELLNHFSSDGGKLIEQAFKEIKPTIVLAEAGGTTEGKLAYLRAEACGARFLDFAVPPFSGVISGKAGVTPRGYAKMVLGPMLLTPRGGQQLLAAMQEQAFMLNLHPALIHALVAEFNIEICRDREQFTQDVLEISGLLGHATAALAWFRIQTLGVTGDIIAVFSVPISVIFNPDYKPQFGYEPAELLAFEDEQHNYRQLVMSRTELPSKEESLLRLLGVDLQFNLNQTIERLKADLGEVEKLEQEYESLMSEGAFLVAALRAKALVLSERKAESPEKLSAALLAEYNELKDNGLFAFAGLIAESMTEYGIELGAALVQEAQRGYWEMLNSFSMSESN